ncbi:MAG: hypothetical protein ABI573_04710 [Chloroflexota bacterium]
MLPSLHIARVARPSHVLVVALLAILVGACSGAPAATFDPNAPCGTDGRAAGAYPDLEARLPTTFEGTGPGTVDSGRHCSEAALGSLIVHKASNVQFAGAVWDLGGGAGISSAIFRLPSADLPADWISEFYDIGARTAKRTENIETSSPIIPGAGQVFRLDTLNDLSLQTVLVWQDGPVVRVVLIGTPVSPSATRAQHDDLVARAAAATVAAGSG